MPAASCPPSAPAVEQSISYQDANGRWASLSAAPGDMADALHCIESEGGWVAMIDGHWYNPDRPLPPPPQSSVLPGRCTAAQLESVEELET